MDDSLKDIIKFFIFCCIISSALHLCFPKQMEYTPDYYRVTPYDLNK